MTAVRTDAQGRTVLQVGPDGLGAPAPSNFTAPVTSTGYQWLAVSDQVIVHTRNSVGAPASSNSQPTLQVGYQYESHTEDIRSVSGVSQQFLKRSGPQGNLVSMLSGSYDTVGRPTSVTRQGVTTTYTYDDDVTGTGQERLIQRPLSADVLKQYDSRGQTLRVSTGPDVVRWQYDDLGRVLVEEIFPDLPQAAQRTWDYVGNTTTYTNRNDWQVVTVADAKTGTVTEKAYDPGGNLHSESTLSTYTQGALKSASNEVGGVTVSNYGMEYDALGRLSRQAIGLGTLPDTVGGNAQPYELVYDHGTYSAQGADRTVNRTVRQQGAALDVLATDTVLDRFDRVQQITEAPGTDGTTTGPLNEKAVDYVYGGSLLNELQRFNAASTNGAFVSNTTYVYDVNRQIGNVTNLANGVATNVNAQTLHYDDYDRVEQVVRYEGDTLPRPQHVQRDSSGHVGQLHDGAGAVIESFVFDARGQRAGTESPYGRITHDGSNRYEYDTEGNVIRQWRFRSTEGGQLVISDENGTFLGFHEEHIEVSQPPSVFVQGWHRLQLTPLRITSTQPIGAVKVTIKLLESTAGFDPVVMEKEVSGALQHVGGDSYVLAKSHAWDQYLSSAGDYYLELRLDVLSPGDVTTHFRLDGTVSFSHYDLYSEFEYDHENRMIGAQHWSVDANDATKIAKALEHTTETYRYDALGNRVHEYVTNSAGGVEEDRTFLFESGRILLEFDRYDRLERQRLYALGSGELLAVNDLDFDESLTVNDPGFYDSTDSETIWTLSDYQGSVSALYASTSATEFELERVQYNAYGMGNNGGRFGPDVELLDAVRAGYLGMEYDHVTELYLDGGRHYDPAGGRYFSPAGLENGSLSIYAFANNSPADRGVAAPGHSVNLDGIGAGWSGWWFHFDQVINSGTRLGGGMQALGGAGQLVGGIGIAVGGCVGGLGVGCLVSIPAGGAIALRGADDLWAGGNTIVSGEHHDTFTYQAVAYATGSTTTASVVDIGTGLISPAAALKALTKAPAVLSRASRLAKTTSDVSADLAKGTTRVNAGLKGIASGSEGGRGLFGIVDKPVPGLRSAELKDFYLQQIQSSEFATRLNRYNQLAERLGVKTASVDEIADALANNTTFHQTNGFFSALHPRPNHGPGAIFRIQGKPGSSLFARSTAWHEATHLGAALRGQSDSLLRGGLTHELLVQATISPEIFGTAVGGSIVVGGTIILLAQ